MTFKSEDVNVRPDVLQVSLMGSWYFLFKVMCGLTVFLTSSTVPYNFIDVLTMCRH